MFFVFIDTITYIVLTLKAVSLSLNFNGQNYGRTITKHQGTFECVGISD